MHGHTVTRSRPPGSAWRRRAELHLLTRHEQIQKQVDGRAVDRPENRSTNLQIPPGEAALARAMREHVVLSILANAIA
jgi:hypothetical protein